MVILLPLIMITFTNTNSADTATLTKAIATPTTLIKLNIHRFTSASCSARSWELSSMQYQTVGRRKERNISLNSAAVCVCVRVCCRVLGRCVSLCFTVLASMLLLLCWCCCPCRCCWLSLMTMQPAGRAIQRPRCLIQCKRNRLWRGKNKTNVQKKEFTACGVWKCYCYTNRHRHHRRRCRWKIMVKSNLWRTPLPALLNPICGFKGKNIKEQIGVCMEILYGSRL